MITKANLPDGCEFGETEFLGKTKSIQTCPGPGGTLSLYIPALMTGDSIPEGKPEDKTTPTPHAPEGLLNDEQCKPTVKKKVTTSNYLKVKMENNSAKNSNWIDSTRVNKESKFKFNFTDGRLAYGSFNTDSTYVK